MPKTKSNIASKAQLLIENDLKTFNNCNGKKFQTLKAIAMHYKLGEAKTSKDYCKLIENFVQKHPEKKNTYMKNVKYAISHKIHHAAQRKDVALKGYSKTNATLEDLSQRIKNVKMNEDSNEVAEIKKETGQVIPILKNWKKFMKEVEEEIKQNEEIFEDLSHPIVKGYNKIKNDIDSVNEKIKDINQEEIANQNQIKGLIKVSKELTIEQRKKMNIHIDQHQQTFTKLKITKADLIKENDQLKMKLAEMGNWKVETVEYGRLMHDYENINDQLKKQQILTNEASKKFDLNTAHLKSHVEKEKKLEVQVEELKSRLNQEKTQLNENYDVLSNNHKKLLEKYEELKFKEEKNPNEVNLKNEISNLKIQLEVERLKATENQLKLTEEKNSSSQKMQKMISEIEELKLNPEKMKLTSLIAKLEKELEIQRLKDLEYSEKSKNQMERLERTLEEEQTKFKSQIESKDARYFEVALQNTQLQQRLKDLTSKRISAIDEIRNDLPKNAPVTKLLRKIIQDNEKITKEAKSVEKRIKTDEKENFSVQAMQEEVQKLSKKVDDHSNSIDDAVEEAKNHIENMDEEKFDFDKESTLEKLEKIASAYQDEKFDFDKESTLEKLEKIASAYQDEKFEYDDDDYEMHDVENGNTFDIKPEANDDGVGGFLLQNFKSFRCQELRKDEKKLNEKLISFKEIEEVQHAITECFPNQFPKLKVENIRQLINDGKIVKPNFNWWKSFFSQLIKGNVESKFVILPVLDDENGNYDIENSEVCNNYQDQKSSQIYDELDKLDIKQIKFNILHCFPNAFPSEENIINRIYAKGQYGNWIPNRQIDKKWWILIFIKLIKGKSIANAFKIREKKQNKGNDQSDDDGNDQSDDDKNDQRDDNQIDDDGNDQSDDNQSDDDANDQSDDDEN